jgi:hypothetical protein
MNKDLGWWGWVLDLLGSLGHVLDLLQNQASCTFQFLPRMALTQIGVDDVKTRTGVGFQVEDRPKEDSKQVAGVATFRSIW